jgi:hypothetical protein
MTDAVPLPPEPSIREALTGLTPYVRHDSNCERYQDAECICGATAALSAMQRAAYGRASALAETPREEPPSWEKIWNTLLEWRWAKESLVCGEPGTP